MALAAQFGSHVQVFEVDAGTREKGRVVVKEEREAERLAVIFTDEHLRESRVAEECRAQRIFGRDDAIREPLVFGELANETEDRREVIGGRGADVHDAASYNHERSAGRCRRNLW